MAEIGGINEGTPEEKKQAAEGIKKVVENLNLLIGHAESLGLSIRVTSIGIPVQVEVYEQL